MPDMIRNIHVCRGALWKEGKQRYFLRIHIQSGVGGEVLRFDTSEAFTKREADYRAVLASSLYGFDRDELPTHPKWKCIRRHPIVMTMNPREWRHFFWMRTLKTTHPQMQETAIPILKAFKEKLLVIFEDMEVAQ